MLLSFDELMHLASHDPEKLESLRKTWISNAINSAPKHNQRRLRGLQFQIDAARELAHNPISSCLRISSMMHDEFSKLRQALNQDESENITQEKKATAAVIPFPLEFAE
ncbi:MAG TPA: DUF3135 domain-containing protein [Oceanospirillales bacterium]|nr:hypothetical protein [Oleispira sp.]HCM04580.1 DUF3135 domain-containing protein [Oceanospirillales bacterium]